MKRSTTIQRSLLLNMVLLIALISGGILGAVYLAGTRSAVQNGAMARIKSTADATEEHLRLLFSGVTQQLLLTRDWGAAGLLAADQPERLDAVLRPILSKTSYISAIMVADEAGHAWALTRTPDARVARAPEVERDDLRSRPWFVGAINTHFREGIYWTQPYSLSASDMPGITASIRCDFDDDGVSESVVALDVPLMDISSFTSGLYVSERGQILVMTADDAVIGMPRAAVSDSTNARDMMFSPAGELGVEEITTAIDTWSNTMSRRGEHFRFAVGGEHWWGGFRHFDIGSNRALWIGVMVPEADFRAEADMWRNYTVAMTIAALGLAMVMASLLARRYARPLASLAIESRRLRLQAQETEPHEFDIPHDGSDAAAAAFHHHVQGAGIREIDALAEDFAQMANEVERKSRALERYSRTLEHKVDERTQDLNRKNLELVDALAQLHEMQQQMLLQEKMASLGNLVAGVAHEVNSPIGAINGAADVVRRCLLKIDALVGDGDTGMDLRDHPEFRKTFALLLENNRLISEGGKRVSAIVKNLKDFSRLDEAERQMADIHQGIDSTLALAHHLLKDRIAVVREFGDLPRIMCYPNQLNQVFMNLFANAAQAIEGKGTITVRTSAERGRVTVSVRDTGSGIDPEHLDRVFDPGFTTKGVGVGTGLGLSISHRIIEKHGGTIHAKSEPGSGTEFVVTLPVDNG